MNQARWQHFPHEADTGVRGIGANLAEAFEQAALAMTAVITDPDRITADTSVKIACQAQDDELLLVDWLNALIYEMAVSKLLFSRFEVSIDNHRLTGRAWGEPLDIGRHHPAVEIKGATFTELKVGRDNQHWIAQCVIDV